MILGGGLALSCFEGEEELEILPGLWKWFIILIALLKRHHVNHIQSEINRVSPNMKDTVSSTAGFFS